MAGRRRPATRRTEPVEPHSGYVTRQTRQSARRPEPFIEPEPQQLPGMTRRGTSRHHQKSLENVAPSASPKSTPDHASPEPENQGLLPVKETTLPLGGSLSETEDAHGSPEMDADKIQDMLDFDIPKLTRWSDKLYDILSSIGGSQPSVDDRIKLNSYRKSFNHARLPFANGNTLFIKPIKLSEEYECDQGVRSKIQVAISSANLVSLLTSLLDVELEKKRPYAILEQLDDNFPALSVLDSHKDKNNDIETILDLAFRVRCRLLIELLVSDNSIPSLEGYFAFATGIFCGETISDVVHARDALDKGPYRPLAGVEIGEDTHLYETYRAHVQELMSKLPFNNLSGLQASLDPKYTQVSIFCDIRSWALRIYRELNRVADQGKVRPANENSRSKVLVERAESESLFVDNGDEADDDSDSASDTDAEGYNQLPPQGSNQNYINSSATLAAVKETEEKASMRPAVKSLSHQQTAKGEKKASDTRDAIRLLEPSQVLNRTRKRSRPGGDSDNEDDGDDFEVNEQLPGESRRVLNENAIIQRPSPTRPRFSKQAKSGKSRDLSPPVASSRGVSSAQPPDDLQDDYNLQDRDILVLSQNARNIRRANHSTKPRQTRTPWSAHDTSRLVDLIADPSLNCSWSAMEKAGGFEHPRNQQALRDKARGLKVWYLEGDKILPPGFDQVALGQKEKDLVIKCGRNPDRREDDLDENGQVTSNIWVG
ncbi:uncharacterized protein F4807DRAFT_414787 [Annulohypoxylon truncatum]|uniref:uncharacterized protein n=1 Tax=Annulohypoxylon truncatum TaxID=327061 RepID=UPI002007E957|nr:uncharacterized protein F4807DRAFT_414787 [Annulohypoxylon truncatum]KAI1212841.1 hypothetical protein F4807DRAFT_414787 [Annulohypoxylon truncatum]